jgi:hypothetical protein
MNGPMLIVIGVVAVVVVLVLVIVAQENSPARKQRRQELEKRMETVKCWIVLANNDLYNSKLSNDSMCQVIFTLDNDVTDLHSRMTRISKQLVEFEPGPDAGNMENAVASVMKTHKAHQNSLLVPSRITDGLKVFTASVYVLRNLLPDKTLTLPFIFCKVCVGDNREPMAGAQMVPYKET